MKDRVKNGQRDYSSTYIGSYCCSKWNSYDNFYSDIICMKGYNEKDDKGQFFEFDKDLLSVGGKVYSKETCCFLPKEVNQFLSNIYRKNTYIPTGVTYNKKDKKYQSQISIDGKRIYLGQYDNVKEARIEYCKARNTRAKALADRYKEQLDIRAYLALFNYEEEEYSPSNIRE